MIEIGVVLEKLSHRLAIQKTGETIVIDIPRNVRLIGALVLSWLAITVGGYAITGHLSIAGGVVILFLNANQLRRERIERQPEGLYCREGSALNSSNKTFSWGLIKRVQLIQHGGWLTKGVTFEYDAAPVLGSRFWIGQSLTRAESEMLADLIRNYKAAHASAH
jgi:hypothetical protein